MSTQLYVNPAADFLQVNGAGDWLLTDLLSRTPPDMPESPAPMAATVVSVSPSFVSVSNSMRRQVRTRGAHQWQIALQYGAMKRATFAPLWAFLQRQGGQAGLFTVQLDAFAPQGTAAGSPLVKGTNQTGLSLMTDGWGTSQVVLKAGDWLQVESDLKVYQVTSAVTSDGSGNATIPIYPALRKVPADNTQVFTDVLFTCSLSGDTLSVDWNQCIMVPAFEINLLEWA